MITLVIVSLYNFLKSLSYFITFLDFFKKIKKKKLLKNGFEVQELHYQENRADSNFLVNLIEFV